MPLACCDFFHSIMFIHRLFTKKNSFFTKNYKNSWRFSQKKNKFEGGMWHCKKAGLFVMPKRLTIDGNKNDEKIKDLFVEVGFGYLHAFCGGAKFFRYDMRR